MDRHTQDRRGPEGPSPEFIDSVLTLSAPLVDIAIRSVSEVEHDITLQQYRALVILAERGPLGLGSLSTALAIHQSTGSRLCDRLVQKGFIDRSPSPDSRRELAMSVTDLGRATIDLVNQYRAQEIAKLAGSLPKSTQTQLAQALRLLAKPPTEHLSIEA